MPGLLDLLRPATAAYTKPVSNGPTPGSIATQLQDRRALYSGCADGLESAARQPPAVSGLIRARPLQPIEVLEGYVTGDVLAGETRGVELHDVRIVVLAGGHEILQILVNQPVGADELPDFLDAAAGRHQFTGGRHVDAIDVGKTHRRSGGCEVDFSGG